MLRFLNLFLIYFFNILYYNIYKQYKKLYELHFFVMSFYKNPWHVYSNYFIFVNFFYVFKIWLKVWLFFIIFLFYLYYISFCLYLLTLFSLKIKQYKIFYLCIQLYRVHYLIILQYDILKYNHIIKGDVWNKLVIVAKKRIYIKLFYYFYYYYIKFSFILFSEYLYNLLDKRKDIIFFYFMLRYYMRVFVMYYKFYKKRFFVKLSYSIEKKKWKKWKNFSYSTFFDFWTQRSWRIFKYKYETFSSFIFKELHRTLLFYFEFYFINIVFIYLFKKKVIILFFI